MSEIWRLLKTGIKDAYYNMALDEAITTARSKDLVPNTLRFFRWGPSAVSIGYFQSMVDEVDVKACEVKGVDYVRRMTGGGAVYHDRNGELTYSIAVPTKHRLISSDIQKTYGILCDGLIEGFKILGIPAEFKPINDILVGGKKISGNAQTRRMGIVHQHGTILVEVDPYLMFSLLKVPDEKIRDKQISAVEERVTSTNKYLGRDVSFDELEGAFRRGFEIALDIELITSDPIEYEISLANNLKKEKFSHKEWNFKR